MSLLKTKGIGTQVHYIPIPSHPFYKKDKKKNKLNNMNKYYNECLSIPIFYSLKKRDQNYIIKTIKNLIE